MVEYTATKYKQILGMSISAFAKVHSIPYETVIHHCKSGYCKLDKRMPGSLQHPLYKCYRDIITRCYNINCKHYHRYGGRGIRMSPEWFYSFEEFVKDMYPTYKKGLTIDRVNNERGYYRDNCRWATPLEQSWNRSVNGDYPGLHKKGPGKWIIQMNKEGKTYYSKMVYTFEEAVELWKQMGRDLGKPV